MHRPRIALYLRNAAFALLALAYSAPFLPAIPAVLLLPKGAAGSLADAYRRGLAFLLDHVCGLTVEVRGLERLADGPVLIAAAHQTTWDRLFLPMLLGHPVMVMGDGLARQTVADFFLATRAVDIAEARAKSRAGGNVLIFPTGAGRGSQPRPPLHDRVAALYETLQVPCVPIALNSSRFWQFRSWLRHPGVVTVEILAPIAPGLEKQVFMDRLATRLHDATERLMHEADPPALMSVPTPGARRIAAAMHATRPSGKN